MAPSGRIGDSEAATRERDLIELVAWLECSRMPREVRALLAALHLTAPSYDALADLSESQWQSALAFADRTQLTLLFGAQCDRFLPDWVRARIQSNRADNVRLQDAIVHSFLDIDRIFRDAGIAYVLLKGATHGASFAPDARCRVYYDIDLFVPRKSLERAYRVVQELGYEPLEDAEKFSTDHLPALVRKTGWQWRGNHFDPASPATVDLHFRFWDSSTERIAAPGVEDFWERRIFQDGVPALALPDRLGYSGLHALRHLLRGSLGPARVHEIAYFLNCHAEDDLFWNQWRSWHSAELRRLEAVVFRLALTWFGGRAGLIAQDEIARLDGDIPLWFERHAASPLEGLFRPNKDDLWLHFSLVNRTRDRAAVFLRRVLPARLPGAIDAVLIPKKDLTPGIVWRSRMRYGAYLLSRAGHHARTFFPALGGAIAWQTGAARLERPFWRFLLGTSLYNLGLFIFFLLFNLYLLDRGYREDFLGLMAGATTIGAAAGVLPAAFVARRAGLKRMIMSAFAASAVVCAALSTLSGRPVLLAMAVLAGVTSSFWSVSIAPAVASLTSERTRALGFSISSSVGIGIGIAGGLLGGRLPGWIAGTSAAQAKQFALLIGCAIAVLSLWPLARLNLAAEPENAEPKIYPRGRFIVRLLIVIGVWNLAVGAFNPLFSAFFSRHLRMGVESIGMLFSASQLSQALAVLLAPMVLRRLGLVRGVAAMQWATAAALGLLALSSSGAQAGALYAAYMSFQYMSDPGVSTLLMGRVAASQRSGASALNLGVMFAAQAVAASAGGAAVAHFGYPAMLGAAAILAAAAGFLFRWLLVAYDERHSHALLSG